MLGICFIVIIPCFWMNVCAVSVLAWWISYGGDLSLFCSGPKEGRVPGCVSHLSVAPWRGKQPWLKTPRCYLLGPKWSMMLNVVTKILFLAFNAFFQVNLLWFSAPGLLIIASNFVNLLFKHCWVGFWQIHGISHRFMSVKFVSISYSVLFYAEAYVKTQSNHGFRQRQEKGGRILAYETLYDLVLFKLIRCLWSTSFSFGLSYITVQFEFCCWNRIIFTNSDNSRRLSQSLGQGCTTFILISI